jgi:heme/copper-type cytochrome/quinol oxidase subunit 2
MKKLLSLVAFLAPSIALAQTQTITDVNSLTAKLVGIGNTVIYLLVALAVIYIIWYTIQYFVKGKDDPTGGSNAKFRVLWGIVGLAIILSIWGLVGILTNTFRTTPANQPIPNLGNGYGTGGGIPANQIPVVQ